MGLTVLLLPKIGLRSTKTTGLVLVRSRHHELE